MPSGVFERFQAAPSKGKFLAAEIKGRFAFEKVRVEQDYMLDYVATTENYDGAPDAHPRDRLMGHGSTPAAAVADLAEQMEEWQ